MRYFLFSIGQKYKLRAEWVSLRRFKKYRYFFFFFDKEASDINRVKAFHLCMFGLYLVFSKPHHKKFSYSSMPEIKGRRKVD